MKYLQNYFGTIQTKNRNHLQFYIKNPFIKMIRTKKVHQKIEIAFNCYIWNHFKFIRNKKITLILGLKNTLKRWWSWEPFLKKVVVVSYFWNIIPGLNFFVRINLKGFFFVKLKAISIFWWSFFCPINFYGISKQKLKVNCQFLIFFVSFHF